ncbi:MAG: hypothetical protein A2157_13360 [Deltaproteobacteria bacterium RBG_16_47_11]|nr:MAG: hypothetical protein A2157_13360 [Deltaproteobacteria bacterium RBG_16_47_11]
MLVGSAFGRDQDSVDLGAYQWDHRLLIVFAPSENDPAYQSLKEQVDHQAGDILDRDLLVFHIFERGESRLDKGTLNPQQASSLRKRFSIVPGKFRVILIGKDGGVKINRESSIDLPEVFSTIDAMPMRQREMKEKK